MEWDKKEPGFRRYKIHHILFWLCYGSFWYIIGQLFTPEENRGPTRETLAINLVYLLANMGAAYVGAYALLPLLLKKQYGKYTALLLLDIAVFSLFIALGFYRVYRDNAVALESIFQLRSIIPATIFSVATAVGIFTGLKVLQSRRLAERKAAQMQKTAVRAELNYLTAQVKPHFLFNAINNIYFLIGKNKDLAADMLLKFSELLRYQLYDCTTNAIGLEQELEYLKNYVELEKIRKSNVKVKFECALEETDFQVAPLLFIPFVENAFKYVSTNPQKENFITVRIEYSRPFCVFEVRNNWEKSPTAATHKGGGIGIENVRRRLTLLYPSRHELHIAKDEDTFGVTLKLDTSHEASLHHY